MAAERVKQGGRTPAELIEAYKGKLLVIVFYASWCRPCAEVLGLLSTAARQVTDKITICRMNIEESKNFYDSMRLKVSKIPVTLFFWNGREVGRVKGPTKVENFIHRMKDYEKKG